MASEDAGFNAFRQLVHKHYNAFYISMRIDKDVTFLELVPAYYDWGPNSEDWDRNITLRVIDDHISSVRPMYMTKHDPRDWINNFEISNIENRKHIFSKEGILSSDKINLYKPSLFGGIKKSTFFDWTKFTYPPETAKQDAINFYKNIYISLSKESREYKNPKKIFPRPDFKKDFVWVENGNEWQITREIIEILKNIETGYDSSKRYAASMTDNGIRSN